MRKLKAAFLRCLNLFRGHRDEDDFAAELQSHIEQHIDDGIRSGLTPVEARRQALIRLGGAEQTLQAYRERRTLPAFESIFRTLRYSVRTLARHPAATAIAILSIGLGIGANATIFSMVSRFVLRPAPVGDPSSLLAIHTMPQGEQCCNQFPLPLYNDVREQAKSFSDVAAFYELIPASIGGNGEPERVWGSGVTTNFFSVLQIPMILGRGFTSNEDTQPSIIIGSNLWHRHFNADPNILGKTVLLSGRTFTVVGVAPASFHSVDQILYTEFWVPLGNTRQLVPNLPPQGARDYHWLSVIARMRPGVTRTQVTAELSTLSAVFAKAYPATDKGTTFVFEQAGTLPPRERNPVLIFLAALSAVVLLVLAIAGANVANLLFAQAAARQREMAVRLALGATRARLRTQLLAESILLGLCGGVLGIAFSLLTTHGLSSLHVPAPVPLDIRVDLDWRVLLYSFALSVLCGLLLGLAPAWAASRPLLSNALKGEDALARPGRHFSLRNLLLVGQVAMSLVLLCITGLFLRSLQNASAIQIGFNPQHLLVLSMDPRINGYTADRTRLFLAQLRTRAAALPGVVSAVTTDVPPLNGGNRSDGFTIAGHDAKDTSYTTAELYMVSPDYFQALGIPRFIGRDFSSETPTGPRTAIVNQAFVDHLFPGQNPIGQHVNGGKVDYEIIGVCGNVKSRTLGEDPRPILYRSIDQSVANDPSLMGYTLVIQSSGNPAVLSEAARRQVYALDPAMAIYNEETMQDHVRTAYLLPHLAATLFGTFGFIGLTLAAVGLYGVMSYSVSRRTREIGIRMALGAKPGSVERLVLRQGFVLTLIAVALGWPAAWMLSKLAASFLYGIQPHDALTFALVPPFLIVIALLACWLPARRAATVDPMQALRCE